MLFDKILFIYFVHFIIDYINELPFKLNSIKKAKYHESLDQEFKFYNFQVPVETSRMLIKMLSEVRKGPRLSSFVFRVLSHNFTFAFRQS